MDLTKLSDETLVIEAASVASFFDSRSGAFIYELISRLDQAKDDLEHYKQMDRVWQNRWKAVKDHLERFNDD